MESQAEGAASAAALHHVQALEARQQPVYRAARLTQLLRELRGRRLASRREQVENLNGLTDESQTTILCHENKDITQRTRRLLVSNR
ncbi:hypothetical protein GCM10022420_083100 [Streptomyces iranensis]